MKHDCCYCYCCYWYNNPAVTILSVRQQKFELLPTSLLKNHAENWRVRNMHQITDAIHGTAMPSPASRFRSLYDIPFGITGFSWPWSRRISTGVMTRSRPKLYISVDVVTVGVMPFCHVTTFLLWLCEMSTYVRLRDLCAARNFFSFLNASMKTMSNISRVRNVLLIPVPLKFERLVHGLYWFDAPNFSRMLHESWYHLVCMCSCTSSTERKWFRNLGSYPLVLGGALAIYLFALFRPKPDLDYSSPRS